MRLRYFALIFGIAFLLTGIAGFIPGLLTHHAADHPLTVDAASGRLLGLFPVNVLHSLVHVLIGAFGILAWRRMDWSRRFGQGVAIFYGVLTILGLIRGTSTLFGLIPIYGHDIWLHAVAAIIAGY